MADKLINADILLKVLDEELEDILKEKTDFSTALKANLLVGFAKQVINDAPTVDAVPVVHGEWQDEQCGRWIYAKCNLCGKVQDVRSNFCPNCGAKMDGKEKSDGTNVREYDNFRY